MLECLVRPATSGEGDMLAVAQRTLGLSLQSSEAEAFEQGSLVVVRYV